MYHKLAIRFNFIFFDRQQYLLGLSILFNSIDKTLFNLNKLFIKKLMFYTHNRMSIQLGIQNLKNYAT